jgi:STE24 endopeptidase
VPNEDKAARYHRLKRRASLLNTVLGTSLLILLLLTGWSAALRQQIAAATGGLFPLTLILYVVLLVVLADAIRLPLSFYQGVTLERRYGLSTETTGKWWLDHMKGTALGLVFAVIGAAIVMSLLRAAPDRWWIVAAAVFSVLMVVLAQLAPVLLIPLFYTVTPLEKPALVERLVKLADRAGTNVLGVFELRMSDRTRKANAALTGIGRTRRILLSDTLLKDYSDDEIEVILGHELAHHVHRDIWKSIAVEVGLIALGFYLADIVLGAAAGRFGLTGKDDIAGLPLLLLAAGLVSVLLLPVSNALSRAHERAADRYAWETTKNPAAFVTAMKRLGAQNLAEEQPSRVVEILFHSHPPMTARIEAAQAWARSQRA